MRLFLCITLVAICTACTEESFDKWALKYRRHDLLKLKGDSRAARVGLFCNTTRIVLQHNKKYEAGESTFYMRVNQFAAHTEEERDRLFGTRLPNSVPRQSASVPLKSTSNGKETNNVTKVDWRNEGRVSSVKNQGQCGSCWAFSAIGAIEGAVSIADNFRWNTSDSQQGYSVDQCVACTQGAMGCEGGWPWLCLEHIINNGGIDSNEDWPYLSDNCNAAKEKFEKVASIVSWSNVTENDEDDLRRKLVNQPVSVSINARCDSFMHYGGGVLDDNCGTDFHQIDHSVLAVGYDTSAKDPYYIVKNSWSEDWGENGYVRMQIGENIDCIACRAVVAKAGPTPPKPVPELKCADGTYDPSYPPRSCPKGSTCCCSQKKFWHPKECGETECCLEGQTCVTGKGCKNSQ